MKRLCVIQLVFVRSFYAFSRCQVSMISHMWRVAPCRFHDTISALTTEFSSHTHRVRKTACITYHQQQWAPRVRRLHIIHLFSLCHSIFIVFIYLRFYFYPLTAQPVTASIELDWIWLFNIKSEKSVVKISNFLPTVYCQFINFSFFSVN